MIQYISSAPLWIPRAGSTLLVAVLIAVVSPAFTTIGLGQEPKADGNKVGKTVVEVATSDKDLNKLVAAVKAAALAEALSGPGPFTLFAPTDKAFEALGEETLKAVLADKEKLRAILTYHVVPGKVSAGDAFVLAKYTKSLKTVNGAEVKLALKGDKLVLDGGATVIKPDVPAGNGVVHVIDKVLLPPAALQRVSPLKLCVPVGSIEYSRAIGLRIPTQKDKERLVELYEAAAAQTPNLGDKAAWKKRNEELAELARKFAEEKDPKKAEAIRNTLAAACADCHAAHKPFQARLCIPGQDFGAYSRALSIQAGADEKDKQQLVERFKAAAELTPPKGDKDAWKKRNEELVALAQEFAAEKDPQKATAIRNKFSASCAGCHADHKPAFRQPAPFVNPGPNGGFGPFPNVEFPKLEFPNPVFPNPMFPNPVFPNPLFPDLGDPVEREASARGKAIGFATEAVTPLLTAQLDLPAGQGRTVTRVTPGSPAAEGGLKPSDLLLLLDGKPAPADAAAFVEVLEGLKPGKRLEVTVLRRGKEQKIELKVPTE